ncbi:Single-stranded DNA-binding protein (fragment) [metagenome]|uniref:Single-stranded DNA-binding protein n=1 Tax=metagenome TaxID=256318 RepID=A0A2P2CCF3_9ZZZZ
MNETQVTLQGWLGSDVTTRMAGESLVANFRVACTPRRFSKKTNDWVDGDTQWYTVNAWRGLAENCAESLHRGDPVVVHGRLNAQVWSNSAGIDVTSFDIEATFVGHDLNRGTTSFQRTTKAESAEDAAELDTASVPVEDAATAA